MINFKDRYFFIQPLSFSKEDMEFNVYDEQGCLLGTNITGIDTSLLGFEPDGFEFEEFIDKECVKAEAVIKFTNEFGVSIKNANTLKIGLLNVVEIMRKKWNISPDVMIQLL